MKKRIIILIGLIITILGAYISFSYALFEKTETQSGNNTISTYNCLDLSIEGEENINITSAFPIQDEEGLLQTPYKFKVKNKCDHYVETEIGIELQSNNTLGDEYLRFKMNKVSEYEDGSIYLLSEKRRYNEVEGESVLDSKYPIIIDELNGNEEKEYELRVWIPYTAGNEVMNKNFKGKVYVSGIVKTDPKYYVNTIEDLVTLSNEVNSGNSYEGVTVVLTKDLNFEDDNSYANATRTDFGDLNGDGTVEGIKTELTKETGKGFTPIGTDTNRFEGNFDGQNHRLDNIYINNSIKTNNIGLFGVINSSIVSNLTLSGKIKTTQSARAGIIGMCYGITNIFNIKNESNITSYTTAWPIGGIVGTNEGNLTIKKAINSGAITGSDTIGGILAYNKNSVVIEDSHNEGDILQNKGSYAGGIIGRDTTSSINTTIKDSYNTGKITFDVPNTSIQGGGLVAVIRNNIFIENSYNAGNIINLQSSYSGDYSIYFGGLVAFINPYNQNYINYIKNSYNTGNIKTGSNRIGGLVAYCTYGTKLIIDKSYNAGDLYSSLYITAESSRLIGGLVGYQQTSTHLSEIYILNSYNVGKIESDVDIMANGLGFFKDKVYILNSYNYAPMANNVNTSLVSHILDMFNGNTPSIAVVNNVFSSESSISSVSGTNYGIGRLQHNTSGTTVNNAYYLDTSATTGSNLGNSATNVNITPLTSAEIAGREFVSTLNKNVNSINLSEISSNLAGYKLSSWIYDPTAGHPVLDNSN